VRKKKGREGERNYEKGVGDYFDSKREFGVSKIKNIMRNSIIRSSHRQGGGGGGGKKKDCKKTSKGVCIYFGVLRNKKTTERPGKK